MGVLQQEVVQLLIRPLMVLQIHDELVFDCVAEEVNTVSEIVKRHMESAVQLAVKLEVNLDVNVTL